MKLEFSGKDYITLRDVEGASLESEFESLIKDSTDFVYRDDGFFMNVKGWGEISIQAWENLASAFGVEENYDILANINQSLIEDYYYNIKNLVDSSWGDYVVVTGRSDGWWGISQEYFQRDIPLFKINPEKISDVENYIKSILKEEGLSEDSSDEDIKNLVSEDFRLYNGFEYKGNGTWTLDLSYFDDLLKEMMDYDPTEWFVISDDAKNIFDDFYSTLKQESDAIENLDNGYDEIVIDRLESIADDEDYDEGF